MSNDQLKALQQKLLEEGRRGDTAQLDDVITPDYRHHDHNGETRGSVDYHVAATALHDSFPDIEYKWDASVADGDRVATAFHAHATHKGTFMGKPATGQEVDFTGIIESRAQDGRLAESWEQIDVAGIMRQLGAIPVHR